MIALILAFIKKFLNSAAGTSGAKPLDQQIGDIQTVIAAGLPAVKLIQRGAVSSAIDGSPGGLYNTSITLPQPVNPAKCQVQVWGRYFYVAAATQVFAPGVISLTSTVLTVSPHGYRTSAGTADVPGQISWEVTEYY